MESAAWVKLLKLIPPSLVDNLMLMTGAGQEIALQNIVRFEDDYFVLRGRLAGTTDTDRVFFIPYRGISHMGFQRPVKEEVLLAMYGELEAPPAPQQHSEPAPPAAPVGPEEIQPLALEPAVVELPSRTTTPTAMPDRAALLDRIRARSQVNDNGRRDADR